MSFLTGQFCMQSRALLRKPSTSQTLEVVDQVVVRCMDCGRFLHWLTVRVTLSQLTLAKGGEHDTRIFEHLWPWFDEVHAAATWLFIAEVQVVGKLLEGNMSNELCQRTIDGVQIVLVCHRMQVSIHPGPSTK